THLIVEEMQLVELGLADVTLAGMFDTSSNLSALRPLCFGFGPLVFLTFVVANRRVQRRPVRLGQWRAEHGLAAQCPNAGLIEDRAIGIAPRPHACPRQRLAQRLAAV